MFYLTIGENRPAMQPGKSCSEWQNQSKRKCSRRWAQKKANDNSNFHEVREIKAGQDYLLAYSDCFTYQATSFQLYTFDIQPNNLHLTYASVPERKSMQNNQSSTTLKC